MCMCVRGNINNSYAGWFQHLCCGTCLLHVFTSIVHPCDLSAAGGMIPPPLHVSPPPISLSGLSLFTHIYPILLSRCHHTQRNSLSYYYLIELLNII